MATSVYAKNLAKAFFEDALKGKELMKWLSELRLISDLAKDASVASVLQKPDLSFEAKSKLLKARAGELDPQVLNLVGMQAAKGKLGELDDISIEYQRLIDAYHGVEGAEVAEVTTAIPLDDEDILKLGKRLGEMLAEQVRRAGLQSLAIGH